MPYKHNPFTGKLDYYEPDTGGGGAPAAHTLGGSSHTADTLANLNAKVSDATLDDSSAARDPNNHASNHTNGTDDIQNATSSQKGLATAAQITKLDSLDVPQIVTISSSTHEIANVVSTLFVSYTSSAPVTITVPTSLISDGSFKVDIVDSGNNSSVNNITVVTEGSETINNESNLVVDIDLASVTLKSDSNNLFLI